jgi:putative spermidine/putrescine transport system permease protein
MAAPSTRSARVTRVGLWLVGVAGLLFLVGPILVIIPLSFNQEAFFNYPMPGLSTRWYVAIFASDAWRRALLNSVVVGLLTTGLATLLGASAAYGIAQLPPRLKSLCIALLISPMIVPGVVIALGLYLFYSSLGLAGSLSGIVLAHTILALPFVVLTMTAALIGFDTNLVRAAASLGATPVAALRRIVLPVLFPAVASGALFAFVTSFDEFIVTSFLAGPQQVTLPLQMWAGVHDDVTPAILAAATLFVIVSVVILLAIETLRRRGSRLGLAQQ